MVPQSLKGLVASGRRGRGRRCQEWEGWTLLFAGQSSDRRDKQGSNLDAIRLVGGETLDLPKREGRYRCSTPIQIERSMTYLLIYNEALLMPRRTATSILLGTSSLRLRHWW